MKITMCDAITDDTTIVIGYNHDNTLNVIRALGKAGFRVWLLLISNTPKNYIVKTKYLYHYDIVKDIPSAIDYLLKIRPVFRVPVITTADKITAELDLHYIELHAKYLIPNCRNSNGGIIQEMDKSRMCQIAVKHNFKIPKTLSIKPDNYNIGSFKSFSFPVIVKPEESMNGSKDDFRICQDINQLEEYLTLKRNLKGSLLIQEFIPNDEVLLVGGVRTPDSINHCVGYINKTKHGKQYNNLGMNAIGVWTKDNLRKNDITDYLNEIDYVGPYSFEFIRHNQELYFVEVNLRTDGLYFFYTHAGVNIPAIWSSYLTKHYQIPKHIKPKVLGMCEFQYIKNYLRPSKLLGNIKDFYKTDVYSIFSISDPKPFIYKFIYHKHESSNL